MNGKSTTKWKEIILNLLVFGQLERVYQRGKNMLTFNIDTREVCGFGVTSCPYIPSIPSTAPKKKGLVCLRFGLKLEG